MPKTDISAEIQRLWALYPVGKRSPAEVGLLLESLGEESNRIRERIDTLAIQGNADHLAPIVSELRAYQGRLIGYELARDSASTEGELAPSVQGLWYRGDKPVPDGVFVPYLANQVEALAEGIDRNTFDRALRESLNELPQRVGSAVGGVTTGLVGGILTHAWWLIPVGLGVWYLTERKSR